MRKELDDSLNTNIAALKTCWNREPFHDMPVESIHRRNSRVIVVLVEYVLILTGTKAYKQAIDEFPTSWITSTLEERSGTGRLAVKLELGTFDCDFLNLRLIRRSDYAILIPQIDPSRLQR
ncbi:MAG: hypothetical protein MUC83_07975 [Pirellula sp.]|nr:hypothetical protein [Pirellula sp.]